MQRSINFPRGLSLQKKKTKTKQKYQKQKTEKTNKNKNRTKKTSYQSSFTIATLYWRMFQSSVFFPQIILKREHGYEYNDLFPHANSHQLFTASSTVCALSHPQQQPEDKFSPWSSASDECVIIRRLASFLA